MKSARRIYSTSNVARSFVMSASHLISIGCIIVLNIVGLQLVQSWRRLCIVANEHCDAVYKT